MNKFLTERASLLASLLIIVSGLVLIIVQIILQRQVDTVTLGLLVVALLPCLYYLVESAQLPGGIKIQMRVRTLEKKTAQQEQELATLSFLITNFLTFWEKEHLRKLDSEQPFPVKESGYFGDEMRRLWHLGLIEGIHGPESLDKMLEEGRESERDVKDYFCIKQGGQEYRRLIESYKDYGLRA